MKNKQIVDSWNKIEPSATTRSRMLDSILTRNHSVQSENKNVFNMTKIFSWKRLTAIAACLVLIVAIIGVFGNKTYLVDLGNGETLSFYKNNAGMASSTWDIDWGDNISRDLTDHEKDMLFSETKLSYGTAMFSSIDGTFIHYEGKTSDGIRVSLSAKGYPATDTFVDGNNKESIINKISVNAGYAVTDANSKGIKTIIYYASFEANGTTAYVDIAGNEADSVALRAKLGNFIYILTQKLPNASKLKLE